MINIDDLLDDYLLNEDDDEVIESGDFLDMDIMMPQYSDEERDIVMRHSDRFFGDISWLIRDDQSHLMHVDLRVSMPTPERDYYTITTVGMGAMLMNVPQELADGSFARAELVICLPRDWNLHSQSRKWVWPIKILQNISRIPMLENSWLSIGHIVPMSRSVADNTHLNAFMLLEPQENVPESFKCAMPDGSVVNFYQLIPLYPEEAEFEKMHGFDALVERMADVSHIVDVDRINACAQPSLLMH